MDRNTIIGFVLIAGLVFAWSIYTRPSKAELEQARHEKDSIAQVERLQDSLDKVATFKAKSSPAPALADSSLNDSTKMALATGKFGQFAPAATGTAREVVIENDKIKLSLNTQCGCVKDVVVKDYLQYGAKDTSGKQAKEALHLLEDPKNRFAYVLPVQSADGGQLSTDELFFTPVDVTQNSVTMRASTVGGGYFEQVYKLQNGSYVVDYKVNMNGLENVFSKNVDQFSLLWINYLDQVEKNAAYEQTMSTVYFKKDQSKVSYCNCRKSDAEELKVPVKWVSNAQQFFNASLIASEKPFKSANVETEVLDLANTDGDLKKLKSSIVLPYGHAANESFAMQFYLGPNEFKTLKSMGVGLEEIIPYGWSFFGTINRYIVRPFFNLLYSFLHSYGWTIIVLTLIVKLLLYPLQYKMIYSSVKMAVLRPELNKIKAKLGDDQTKFAAEQMKLFRESGVNPLAGCLPAVLQMPIWIALYRFFPASIDFRQESFLWADDLSTFDNVINFGFNLPFIGSHLSLFTILWVVSMLVYAKYNEMMMDSSLTDGNPVMKYMPYVFPVIFFFALNSWAAGLTCYMLFSNVFNVGLTMLTKNVIIKEDKVLAEMELARTQPKKQSKFQARLEEAMKQQQALQEQKNKNKK